MHVNKLWQYFRWTWFILLHWREIYYVFDCVALHSLLFSCHFCESEMLYIDLICGFVVESWNRINAAIKIVFSCMHASRISPNWKYITYVLQLTFSCSLSASSLHVEVKDSSKYGQNDCHFKAMLPRDLQKVGPVLIRSGPIPERSQFKAGN